MAQDDPLFAAIMCIFSSFVICFILVAVPVTSPVTAAIHYGVCKGKEWKCEAYINYPVFQKEWPIFVAVESKTIDTKPTTYWTSLIWINLLPLNIIIFVGTSLAWVITLGLTIICGLVLAVIVFLFLFAIMLLFWIFLFLFLFSPIWCSLLMIGLIIWIPIYRSSGEEPFQPLKDDVTDKPNGGSDLGIPPVKVTVEQVGVLSNN